MDGVGRRRLTSTVLTSDHSSSFALVGVSAMILCSVAGKFFSGGAAEDLPGQVKGRVGVEGNVGGEGKGFGKDFKAQVDGAVWGCDYRSCRPLVVLLGGGGRTGRCRSRPTIAALWRQNFESKQSFIFEVSNFGIFSFKIIRD
jgi:hypothetical protein